MIAHRGSVLPHYLPLRRLLIALGISLLVHFLLAGGWDVSGTRSAGSSLPARLTPMSAVVQQQDGDITDIHRIALVTAPAPVTESRRISPPTRSQAPAAVDLLPVGAADGGPDPRFYLARELDQYPLPLSVLRLDHGNARLWVSIDQAGQVVEAAVVDADPSGEIERLARDRVLATRFAPAQRDGRPVKSRVLLVLGGGA
jgi:protein TonB